MSGRIAAIVMLALLSVSSGLAAAPSKRGSRLPMAPGVAGRATLAERPATWGTAHTSVYRIPAQAFYPNYQDGTVQWSYEGGARWQANGDSDFVAPIQVPPGALILGIELAAYDANVSADMSASLEVVDTYGSGFNYGGAYTSGTSGNQTVYYDVSAYQLTVDNLHKAYYIDVSYDTINDNTLLLGSVAVYYRMQLSPAPATATFGDVPTNHPYFRAIEALASSGITGGCGGGNFCPNQAVTRGEMAKFLANALGLYWE